MSQAVDHLRLFFDQHLSDANESLDQSSFSY